MVAAREVDGGVGGAGVGVDPLDLGEDLPDLVVGACRIGDGLPEGEKRAEGGDGLTEAVARLGDECAAGAKSRSRRRS